MTMSNATREQLYQVNQVEFVVVSLKKCTVRDNNGKPEGKLMQNTTPTIAIPLKSPNSIIRHATTVLRNSEKRSYGT